MTPKQLKKPENMGISEMALEILGVARELLCRSLCMIGYEYTEEIMLRQDIKAFLEATKTEPEPEPEEEEE